MPTLKHAEFISFDPNRPAPAMGALQALLKERVPTHTGLKVRRILRKMEEEASAVLQERERLLDQYAVRDEESGDRKVEGASYVLADPLGFDAEFRALMSAEVEFADALLPGDLVRRERDPSGKVTEVDDLPLEVILNLGALLQDDAAAAS